jgi:hypothetical protein
VPKVLKYFSISSANNTMNECDSAMIGKYKAMHTRCEIANLVDKQFARISICGQLGFGLSIAHREYTSIDALLFLQCGARRRQLDKGQKPESARLAGRVVDDLRVLDRAVPRKVGTQVVSIGGEWDVSNVQALARLGGRVGHSVGSRFSAVFEKREDSAHCCAMLYYVK